MNSHDDAIVFQNVCKTYRLYKNQWQMVRDALGFKTKGDIQNFYALKNINLTIKKGERVGLIGRNGAGKSTLLKLITGNFKQSSGNVIINGGVQALMNMGIGFHPEFTGLENIKASLLYNGLNKQQFDHAVEEIIDFVELGEFIEQPLKTYSLGMQSRLYFAVATAIQPEILIIDEVLGAGDAYFSAKSADRMKKLTNSGCTLILVSHSTQQVLQFCDKAFWIETGEIVKEGGAIEIIKAYEEYSKKLELESSAFSNNTTPKSQSTIQSKWLREKLLKQVLSSHNNEIADKNHSSNAGSLDSQFSVSRWPAHETGLKIYDVRLLDASNQAISQVEPEQKLNIEISIIAEATGSYNVYFVILLFTEDGRWLTRHCSDMFYLEMDIGEICSVSMQYDSVLLGRGSYVFSAAIYKSIDLNDLTTARYYDLLSRSFEFKVIEKYKNDSTLFYHPATWKVENNRNQLSEKTNDYKIQEF